MDDFEQFKIKEYDLWNLYLHKQQYSHLGRSYAWAKREDALDFNSMNTDESRELMEIIKPEYEKFIKVLFQPDKINFSIMCNETHHLHGHFVPRYNDERTIYDFTFRDHNQGGNYAPYPKPNVPIDILLKIRNDIREII